MRTLCLLVLFGIHPSCFAQAVATKSTTERKPPPAIAEIDEAMQAFVDSGDISGAVTLVGHKGKVVHYGTVGLADIASDKEMKALASHRHA